MVAANDRYTALARDARICSPAADRARRLPLVVIAIASSAIVAGCSHAPSSTYATAAQPQPQAQRLAGPRDPAAAAVEPAPTPPDEYEQALASAYPSESLVDLVRGSQNRSPPVPVAAPPAQVVAAPATIPAAGLPGQIVGPPAPGAGMPAPVAGQPLALNAIATSSPAATAGQGHPGAQPGFTPALAPIPTQALGSAPAPAAAAPPAPQPDEYDQALTAAYPSESLIDFFRRTPDPASR